MQPNIDELRNIRNSYYNSDAYNRNRRNNSSERLRNRSNRYYNRLNDSSESDRNSDSEEPYYNREPYYRRRKRNGIFQKINSIIKTIFNRNENVIYAIIIQNILVYILWEYAIYIKEVNFDSELLDFMHNHFTISWSNLVRKKRYWTVLTSMFSHQDLIHLANNMFTFYSFSLPVIRCIGKKKFIISYLLSGISSSLAHVYFYHSIVPRINGNRYNNIFYDLFFSIYVKNSYDNVSGLGASGAITGINTIFACLYPTRLVTYNNYLRLPAWLTMSLFIFGDFYRSITLTNGNIDTIGHVGGGIAGYLFYLYSLKPYIYR